MDKQTYIVEILSRPTNFHSIVVKPYLYRIEEPIELLEMENPSSDSDRNSQYNNTRNNMIVIDHTARHGRGRPKGLKNRLRSTLFSNPIDKVLLIAKEQIDLALSAKLH